MGRPSIGILVLTALLSATTATARAKVKLDIDVGSHGRPRHTRFRRVHRFGWHSGRHYGPYTDALGRHRVGWHNLSHRDWYVIDLPVMDRAGDDWQVFVKFGKHKTLRVKGGLTREFRERTTIGPSGDSILGWFTPGGKMILVGPANRMPPRFIGHGWTGRDLGNSIIIADVPARRGVQVYLKKRTKNLPTGEKTDPAETPEERLRRVKDKLKRDELLDRADRKFALAVYPQAAKLYSQALALDEKDPIARFAVAHSLFALGVYKSAGKNVRLGLDEFPEWGVVDLALPKFYQREEGFDHHLARLRAYVRKHPDDRDARLLLGYCLHFSGRRAAARNHFETLARQPGGDRHADRFLDLYRPPEQAAAKAEDE